MRINNLNEQIDRIKSLFTEERMFGNLIKEDVNGDPIESYTDIVTSNDFKTQDDKAKEPIYSREFKPYNIVKVKERLNELGRKVSKDFDFNRASIKLSIKFIKSDQNIVTGYSGSLEFPYKDNEDKDQVLPIGVLFDSTKETNITAETFKTKFSEALKSEWLKSKAGTNPMGDFSTKQDAKDSKENRKDDVSATRKEINMSKDECREHMKSMTKRVRQGETRKEIGQDNVEAVEWCMSAFYNTFEKEGLFRKGDEIRIMYKTLGLTPTEKMVQLGAGEEEEITGDTFDEKKVEGGVEGERYVVKDKNGTKIAIIRKVGGNKFNFRSKANVPLVDKNDKGNIKFRKEYISDIYKELNIDPNKQRIVIQKAVETDKMDVGTFVLSNVQ